MFFDKTKKQLAETEEQLDQTRLELQHARTQVSELEQALQETKGGLQNCVNRKAALIAKYSAIIDQDKVMAQNQAELDAQHRKLYDLNERFRAALKVHEDLEKQIALYEDTLETGSYGLYVRQFSFETSERFKTEIEHNYEKQKQLIKVDKAVVCHTEWTVGGSKAEGKKMTNQYKKLMLFAFNGECDGLIAKVKWNNATKTKERILKSFENINKLGVTQCMEITKIFLNLKLEEFALTYEYEQKKYDEKEEQRRIREQMRDEEKAQKELERAQRDAEDEERRYQKALDKARLDLGSAPQASMDVLNEQIKVLEQQLQAAHERKERAIALAQITKVGHIYVISNLGSFGEDVYKIGMTRRLDPMDRVRELGDASVPFQFDVHAIIYSENAPQLEHELHLKFGDRRLNRMNNRKEFFRVTLDEIETFVQQHAGAAIEFTKLAEAREYRETVKLLEQMTLQSSGRKEESRFPASLV